MSGMQTYTVGDVNLHLQGVSLHVSLHQTYAKLTLLNFGTFFLDLKFAQVMYHAAQTPKHPFKWVCLLLGNPSPMDFGLFSLLLRVLWRSPHLKTHPNQRFTVHKKPGSDHT